MKNLYLAVIFILGITAIQAQNPWDIDPTFNYDKSFSKSGNIIVLGIQTDGKVVAVGDFKLYNSKNDQVANTIFRLNTDGKIDTTFNTGTGFNSPANSLIIQSDGKLIVGGTFSSYNGNYANSIARLNPDGNIDKAFVPEIGDDRFNLQMIPDPDGKIYVSLGAVNSLKVIRLNNDGTLDNKYQSDPNIYYLKYIYTMTLQPDGKIILGGHNITRLNTDGTIDKTFNTGSGFADDFPPYAVISHLVVQPNGKILVSGEFVGYNGIPVKRLVRLNADGSYDNSFQPAIDIGRDVPFMLQPDGKILVAIANSDASEIHIIRFNNDGTIDNTYDDSKTTGFNGAVFSFLRQNNGKILVGGSFTSYNGTPAWGIIRLLGTPFLSNQKFTDIIFSFYPNPVIDRINIQAPADFQIDRIIITDLSGKSVLKFKNTSEINVETLASGIYILTAYSGGEKWKGKFVKE